MKDSENPYKLLKVDSEAPLEVVKAAYKALMKTGSIHPDLFIKQKLRIKPVIKCKAIFITILFNKKFFV